MSAVQNQEVPVVLGLNLMKWHVLLFALLSMVMTYFIMTEYGVKVRHWCTSPPRYYSLMSDLRHTQAFGPPESLNNMKLGGEVSVESSSVLALHWPQMWWNEAEMMHGISCSSKAKWRMWKHFHIPAIQLYHMRYKGFKMVPNQLNVELGMDIEQGMGIEMQGGRTHMMGGTCRGFDLELRSGLETQRGGTGIVRGNLGLRWCLPVPPHMKHQCEHFLRGGEGEGGLWTVEREEWDIDDPAGDLGAFSKHGMMWGCETSMEVLGCAASGVGAVMTKNGWRMRC
ncbi:hypothetical protein B0H10DRAFT_2298668 [Mycena sp. CBHHK59/15]|nr:hypothetical protein B0H10DRAFT_2298668 [Mycena sp. CBHHK59/15]